MQLVTFGKPFHRGDGPAFRLGAKHQAGADELPVEGDAAGAAVAGAAAFLGTGEPEPVAQHFQQGFTRVADEFRRIAVDRGADHYAAHRLPPARS
jgi:hypothetical protein